MIGLRRFSAGMLLFSCCVTVSLAGAPGGSDAAKLHPFFQRLQKEQTAQAGAPLRVTTYDVIISTSNPDAVRAAGYHVNSEFSGFVTARITDRDLAGVAAIPEVSYIDPGSENHLQNDVSVPETGATLLAGGLVNGTSYKGAGAIVVMYDTGIDWKHLDFRDPADTTKSRILFIWDQTLTPGAGETSPAGLSYGVEYTKAQIENEIDGSPAGFVREKDINGHGTHTAGTAAGNGRSSSGQFAGMAPLADIIVVKGGDQYFYDARMIDGLTYAASKAAALGKPVAVNYSIGGQTGPHDGTMAYEVAMASFTSTPGRAVVISAGNDGDKPIHLGATIAAGAGLTVNFVVPSYTPAAGTDANQFLFDGWFDGAPNIQATVTSPNSITYTRNAGETGDAPSNADGTITLWNLTSSLNGCRNVQCKVHDNGSTAPRTGTWTLTLTNLTGSSVTFDGWLTAWTVGSATVTLVGGGYDKTVSQPGTSTGVITTASYVTKWGWPSYVGGNYVYTGTDRTSNISSFSSMGPTRDGRIKPDIAAPGQGIGSCLSTMCDTTGQWSWIMPGQKYWLMQGTSMAAPHVTGACALLLGINPSYTLAAMRTLLQNTANTDAYTGSVPNTTWGSGKLDVAEAAARYFSPSAVITRKAFSYDQVSTNVIQTLTGSQKFAVRFSPDVAGRLSALQLNLTTLNNRPIEGAGPLKCEIYSDNAGRPGTLIGSTVTQPLQRLGAGYYNYVPMLDAHVTVNAGTQYHAVLSVTNATDTVKFRSDTATVGVRGSLYNGSSWSAVGYNLRTRAVVISGSGVSSVATAAGTPQKYELLQNYPNPFNPSTTITFSIPERSRVTLKIYDLLGQEVETLLNDDFTAGKYSTRWDAAGLATGTYFYRLEAGKFTETKKVLLLK